MSLPIPFTLHKAPTYNVCAVCGKRLRGHPYDYPQVFVIKGKMFAHGERKEDESYLYPLGSECKKKVPAEYQWNILIDFCDQDGCGNVDCKICKGRKFGE